MATDSESPEIVTERLVLRRHGIEDFAACAAMWADPVVTRHIGGRAFTGEETWARLLRYIGHWKALGFGYWAIEEKATGAFVGEAGFADFHRELAPSLSRIPEIGWAFVSRTHGKGYATETIRAVVDWGDTHLRSTETFCLINPENLASLRVAAKCGYRESMRTAYKGQPVVICVRDTPR